MRNAAERIESPAGIRCPVCGAPPAPSCEWHPAARAKPTCPCVVRCRGCGHRFRPRPDDALVRGTVYDARYHDGRQTRGTPGFVFKQATFTLHLREIGRACGSVAGKTLLDVGCATGDFLEMARSAGLDASGVDISAHAVARATARGLRAVCGTIDAVVDGPFDVIHTSHVLEHVPDVRAFATRMWTLLRPGGIALVEVPNEFENLLSALPRLLGGPVGGRFDAPHLHYFGAGSLARLFLGEGFAVRRILTYSHRRPVDHQAQLRTLLRHVHGPNALLRIGDRIGRGRNLVLVGSRPS